MKTFDPFAVFGLPREYGVDLADLDRIYLQRSAALHPDMLGEAGFSDLGGDGSVGGEIAELNRAKQVLEDPEQRAIALWSLCGGVEDKSLSPGFLMEMMEVRGEIEAAQQAGDPVAIARWELWADERRKEYQRRVGGLFAKLGSDTAVNTSVLKEIKLELNGWRYIERLAEQLHP